MRLLFTACCLLWISAAHSNVFVTTEANNLRQTFDFSTRTIHVNGNTWHVGAFGFDRWQVISGPRGDIGTLTLQPYILRIDNSPNAGGLFSSDHDWALQWRIANFNYTGLGHGKFNIRVGHFELPFGLEQVEQTNGTLYQLNAPANTGLKADWGTSINGVLSNWEYELAYTLGEGNELSSVHGGLWSGRVGTSRNNRLRLGFSALSGEQQEPELVERRRVGMDITYQLGAGFSAAFEHALGEDESADVNHTMVQTTWVNRVETLNLYLQWRQSDRETSGSNSNSRSLRFGVRFEPNVNWSLSAQWDKSLESFSGANSPSVFIGQFRYRI